MKKRIALGTAIIFITMVVIGGASGVAFAKEYKIGYVDLARVFDEYKKTKDSEKALEDKAKGKEAERKKLIDEIKRLKDEQALLSEKAKAEKETSIDNVMKNLQDFDRNSRDELMKQRSDMLNGLLKDIEKVVTDYAKENGYDLIMNLRMLLYGSEQYDLTNEILKRLNK